MWSEELAVAVWNALKTEISASTPHQHPQATKHTDPKSEVQQNKQHLTLKKALIELSRLGYTFQDIQAMNDGKYSEFVQMVKWPIELAKAVREKINSIPEEDLVTGDLPDQATQWTAVPPHVRRGHHRGRGHPPHKTETQYIILLRMETMIMIILATITLAIIINITTTISTIIRLAGTSIM